MSQENLEIVRSMYAGFSGLAKGGDVTSYVKSHYDPEIEYQSVEEADVIKGHDQLIQWNERWFEVWREFAAEIDELTDHGSVVVAVVTVGGKGSESGMEISQRVCHVMELHDGKILRMREFLDRAQALEAAGLSE